MDTGYMFIGISILVFGGMTGSMYSLETGRIMEHQKAQDMFGENYIETNCDGSGTTFDCDIYTEDGEFLGRYHMVAKWGHIFDREAAYEGAKITKLQQPLKNHQQDGGKTE